MGLNFASPTGFEAETTEAGPSSTRLDQATPGLFCSRTPKDFRLHADLHDRALCDALKARADLRAAKVIGLSVDFLENYEESGHRHRDVQGARPNFPMIGDTDFNVSKLYGMLPASTSGDPADRTPGTTRPFATSS